MRHFAVNRSRVAAAVAADVVIVVVCSFAGLLTIFRVVASNMRPAAKCHSGVVDRMSWLQVPCCSYVRVHRVN